MFRYFITYFTLILFLGVFFRNLIKVVENSGSNCIKSNEYGLNKPLREVLIFMSIFLSVFSLIFVPHQLDVYLIILINVIIFSLFNLYLYKLSCMNIKFMNISFSFIGSVYSFIMIKLVVFFIVALTV